MTKINEAIRKNSLEAELSIIAACLVDLPSAVSAVDLVDPSDMQHPKHRIVFNAIVETVGRGGIPDMITVFPMVAGQVDASWLSGLADNPLVGSAFVRQWSTEIKRQAKLQRLAEAGDALATAARTAVADPDELIDHHIQKFIGNHVQSGRAVGMRTAMGETMRGIEERGTGKIESGILTGFIAFDRIKQGLRGGELIVFGGRPGSGKSVWAGNVAVEAAKQGDAVLIFSLEMQTEDFTLRMLSSVSGINLQSVRSGQLDDQQGERVKRSGAMLENLPITIDDSGGLTIGQLVGRARAAAIRSKVALIIVDYLQLVQGKGDTRQQQVGDVTRTLKALSKDLNIPIIGLSQLNRGIEGREDKRPRLSDLRESGDIEQDADLVGLLYRIECGPDSPMFGKAELIIAKHRNGPTGKVDLQFEGHFCRFREV